MIQAFRKRLRDAEEGFTLIELMVVVLIIAILIAIAIPTFLGARSRAQDKAAQSNVRNGSVAGEEYYVDNENYGASVADLEALEPQLNWSGSDASAAGVRFQGAGQLAVLCSTSQSGTSFYLAKIATGTTAGTYYGKTAVACADQTQATVEAWTTTTAGWK